MSRLVPAGLLRAGVAVLLAMALVVALVDPVPSSLADTTRTGFVLPAAG